MENSLPFSFDADAPSSWVLLLGVLAPLLGFAWSYSVLRRAGTNRPSVFSLMAVFLASFLVAGGGLISRSQPDNFIFKTVPGFFAVGIMLGAIFLALLGLRQFKQQTGRFLHGKPHAVIALSVAGLVVFFYTLGLYRVLQRQQSLLAEWSTLHSLADTELISEAGNFKFRPPGKDWNQGSSSETESAASIVFVHKNPEIYFVLKGEAVGLQAETNLLKRAEQAEANLRRKAPSAKILARVPMTLGGIAGIIVESEAVIGGAKTVHQAWFATHNGFNYEMVTWGLAVNRGAIQAAAKDLFAGFDLVDPALIGKAAVKKEESIFTSETFGYTVKLADSDWHRIDSPNSLVADGDFSARNNRGGSLAVAPVFLMGQTPTVEALASAFLARLEMRYPDESISDRKEIKDGILDGYSMQFRRQLDRGDFLYRVKMLKGGGFAYLVAARVPARSANAEKILEEALSRVSFSAPVHETLSPDAFNAHELRWHIRFFSELGAYYYRTRNFDQGAEAYKLAFEMDKKTPFFLVKFIEGRMGAGRYREALDYLQPYLKEFSKESSLQATEAVLLSEMGEKDAALATYARLFAGDFQDENYFARYLNLVRDLKSPDAALMEIEKHPKNRDALPIRLLEASLYQQKKNYPAAVGVLKSLHEKYPFNRDVAYSLIENYYLAGEYTESLEISRAMEEAGDNSGYLQFLQGRSETGLKWYRRAKHSLESALERSPDNLEAKNLMNMVSAMLGEGSNTMIKAPIPAVAVPPELLTNALPTVPSAYLKDYGAYQTRRITAISFMKNKELRTTEHYQIKILDAAGVSRFSSFQFVFNPLAEAIYVNQLLVKDASDKILATGNVSDYYVIDDASTTMATVRKVLNVPIPGLKPGVTVDVVVTRKDLNPVEDFRLLVHTIPRSAPVLETVLFIQGDIAGLKYQSTKGVEQQKAGAGLAWVISLPPVYQWEPYQQNMLDFTPFVAVGDATATWAELAQDYLASIRDRLVIDREVQDLAAHLVKGISEEAKKVDALAAYVQSNYTYKAIEFGRRALIPQTCTDIIKNRYGDCKDHALLLYQLLRSQKIPAFLTLVSNHRPVIEEIPSLEQFDHVVVYVPDQNGGRVVDTTDKSIDVSLPVPYGFPDKKILILDEQKPHFFRVPAYPQKGLEIADEREVQILNLEDILVHEKVTLHGYLASYMRGILKSVGQTDRKFALQQQISAGENSLILQQYSLENFEVNDAPFILDVTYLIRNKLKMVDGRLIGPLPALWERHYLGMEYGDARRTPFQIEMPITLHSRITVTLPPNYDSVDPALFTQSLEGPYLRCKSVAERRDQVLRIDYELQQQGGKFTAAQYPAYQKATDRALNVLEQTIALKAKDKN